MNERTAETAMDRAGSDAQNSGAPPDSPRFETDEFAEKRFRGWHLIGWILVVVVALALISAAVDWIVIGPLEGRAF
jgi:hypothetical protein